MEVKILGIDVTDTDTSVMCSDSEEAFHFPAAICRDKSKDLWYIGEEAFEKALSGKGILTDRLLKMTRRGGTATIRGVRHEGEDLLCRYLSVLKERCLSGGEADAAVIVLPDYRKAEEDRLLERLERLGFPARKTYLISREESFLYYVMSQPKTVRQAEVGLFDLADQSLVFYELKTAREKKRLYVRSESAAQEEAFTLSVLNTHSGEMLADKIMTGTAARLLKNKVFSAVFLTGRGFQRYDWADGFMRTVCARRKVFLDQELFVKGALVRGNSLLSGGGDPGFTALCSGRSETGVTVRLKKGGRLLDFPLISPGDPFMSAGMSLRLLPEDRSPLELTIERVGQRQAKTVPVSLQFLPERPGKAGFLNLSASFPDEKTMVLKLTDGGFGEIFPRTDASWSEEVPLWD